MSEVKLKPLPKVNPYHVKLANASTRISDWRMARAKKKLNTNGKIKKLCTNINNSIYHYLVANNAVHVYIIVDLVLYKGGKINHPDNRIAMGERFRTIEELYESRAFNFAARNDGKNLAIAIMRRGHMDNYDTDLYAPCSVIMGAIEKERKEYREEIVHVPELDRDMSRGEIKSLIKSLESHISYTKM